MLTLIRNGNKNTKVYIDGFRVRTNASNTSINVRINVIYSMHSRYPCKNCNTPEPIKNNYLDLLIKNNYFDQYYNSSVCKCCKGSIKCICNICKGRGKTYGDGLREYICDNCHGRGLIVCNTCDGTGKYNKIFERKNV
jgi:hypothetical protein